MKRKMTIAARINRVRSMVENIRLEAFNIASQTRPVGEVAIKAAYKLKQADNCLHHAADLLVYGDTEAVRWRHQGGKS